MAETVTIEGQPYLKRNPLGTAGLVLITLGIYFFYWYFKINEDLQRFHHDDTISPTRSLMAVLFGWIIIVPPFIALWNTAKHIQRAEDRVGNTSKVEPALVLVIQVTFALANPPYIQDHLNKVWDAAAGGAVQATGSSVPPPPPAPPAG